MTSEAFERMKKWALHEKLEIVRHVRSELNRIIILRENDEKLKAQKQQQLKN